MNDLVVRRLRVDLDTPPVRHWAGDAFRTAFFNALSFSFPAGEQFFIDSMRRVLADAPPGLRAQVDAETRGFIGQEATHRRIHERFNAHLLSQGFVNHWDLRIRRRQRKIADVDARAWLGITAATEHFTAFFADHLLAHPELLQGAEPRWQELWLWHASEESEHRAVAFDLYRAAGGSERWRRRLFWMVSLTFATDLVRQTCHNLWRDGSWWHLSTWTSAWRVLFGRGGLVRERAGDWARYLRADFHPLQAALAPGQRWLDEHAALAPPVAAPSEALDQPLLQR
ncbi:MAG: metal-dependent hydrolase [Rubrivivax sp.]